ncbi:hypothetical protein B0T10DRAFT_457185 [Thelonectria olida]|uniref:Uncharacterized protein n=1 Tax=Thelonectria olida TaxID=1576542 RepID=A0A9P9ASP6_9HYPO|nr:hypothetical protein B0T10DRAFT_457185 [Thelonectria olida]
MRPADAKKLCPWMTEEDFNLIRDLGLPDPYHWPSMQLWTDNVLRKFHARRSDSNTVRQRFIRTKCVLCRSFCEDMNPEVTIDPAVALPCGHVMGWTCYGEFVRNFEAGEGSGKCPWDGPRGDEPTEWSFTCDERILYACEHPEMYARIPSFGYDFYLPEEFFITRDCTMDDSCRRCIIRRYLVRWTREMRDEKQNKNIVLWCAGVNGLTDEECVNLRLARSPNFEASCPNLTELMSELFKTTPTPAENGVLEEFDPTVVCYSIEQEVSGGETGE